MSVLAGIRDVAIIILAILSIVSSVLLVILLIQLQRLIKLIREEVQPILHSANDTVSTVRGTTTFMSQHLVKPLVEASSTLAGVRRAIKVITHPSDGKDSRQ